jgi:biopolymer transport protein ExbB
MIVQRPGVMERIEKGEAVGWVIIIVGGIAFVLAVYQALYLAYTRVAVSKQLRELDQLRTDNPLGRVLASVKTDPDHIEADAEVVELRVSEAVLREVPRLERFQPFLRLAVAAGPLLGLVGTVIGMIVTFQSITESGSSDPKLMANGIGQAMIATVLGLGIAIPLLFMNASSPRCRGRSCRSSTSRARACSPRSFERKREVLECRRLRRARPMVGAVRRSRR